MLTDELLYLREIARADKDYARSDEIRDLLRTRSCFVIDTPAGQEAWHYPKGFSYEQFLDKQNRDRRSNALFDAWLYTMNRTKL
jgi:hypothetical protein